MSIILNDKVISGTYMPQSYRYVGEIFQSILPINDVRVALLDGHKIYDSDGHGGFIQYLNSLVALYPQLACTEEEWQLSNTTYGECGKFVVNEDGSIRLPKIVSFIQGLSSLQDLATLVEAGLPNITGDATFGSGDVGARQADVRGGSGAFKAINTAQYASSKGSALSDLYDKLQFNASLSNPIYGNSSTVQPQSIRYPYYIVLATGVSQELRVKQDLTTNNPFSLLDYKYSEYELNNLSWLRSEGQYNSKAVYPAVYDLLLKIYNGTETKAGVSVKLTTETFTDYDFVLNTAEETFRLPIKVKLASGKAVVGNGMALGLTDGNNNFGLANNQSNYIAACFDSTLYGKNVGTDIGSGLNPLNTSFGITTDPTKSGIETSDSDLYLYFYVGETVQNANLVNIGRIQETYTTKSMVDGQWISFPEIIEVGSPKSLGAYTFDISNYLPNDGYIYDVFLECGGSLLKGGTGTIAMNVSSSVIPHNCKIAQMSGDDSANQFGGVAIPLPIGTDRVLTVSLTGSSGVTLNNSYVYLYAYRRLGTNL